jgi:hypothetical protein
LEVELAGIGDKRLTVNNGEGTKSMMGIVATNQRTLTGLYLQ